MINFLFNPKGEVLVFKYRIAGTLDTRMLPFLFLNISCPCVSNLVCIFCAALAGFFYIVNGLVMPD